MTATPAHERRILVAALGMTPQIITETIYALRVAAAEPFAVNEVRIVTTERGKQQAETTLITGGQLAALCREYDLGDIRFDADCIEVIRDGRGSGLQDIQTPEHNRIAADTITDFIRRLTIDPSTALHVSLAGGRKTMGYYIGYALSLYGRAQDRLSHVLVEEGFETTEQFFFPTRTPGMMKNRRDIYVDPSKAKVMLAEIPFVRLRGSLPPKLLETRTSFSEAVRWSNLDAQPPTLEISVQENVIRCSGEKVKLTPAEMAFYTVFARAAKDGEDIEGRPDNKPFGYSLAEELARFAGISDPPEDSAALLDLLREHDELVDARTVDKLAKGVGLAYMGPLISKIRNKLQAALGKKLGPVYEIRKKDSEQTIVNGKKTLVPMYGLTLEPSSIIING
jgi:CRISPR-associated protein (TIGR02584 family)